MRPLAAQRGFTLLEITVGFALFTALIALLGSVYASSDGLARQCLATMSTHEEHRRNLNALANLCRAAATDKFTGFATNNTSTAPSFQCVIEADSGGRVFGPVQTISWRANKDHAPGVATGELIVTENSVATVVARHVHGGSFRATLMGNTLRLTLTTYDAVGSNKPALVSGEVSVALRNTTP